MDGTAGATLRLDRDYPALRAFGVDAAQALVERGKILPILDGLDEVPATLQPGIITALDNALLAANSGLILTSRRAEYAVAVTGAGCREVSSDTVLLVTSHHYADGDTVELMAQTVGDEVIVSDGGEVLARLDSVGVNVDSRSRVGKS